ncbi:hypothetical protein FOZ63_003830 [Perkinsus olseni]|uniref:Uncharacterized protein n=1 Tax=Perkinsus olseni TaxID=32597 RepID=A0A7J6TGN5_PEROL|nr:hypothetical protein FOZ63_003830 [Perkinsus olseni]
MGHAAESCPRDPNVRSLRKGFQVGKELRRLEILRTAAMAGGRRTRATIGPGDQTGPSAGGEMANTINTHLRSDDRSAPCIGYWYEAVEVMAAAGDSAVDFSDISSSLAEKSAEREAILGLTDSPEGADNKSNLYPPRFNIGFVTADSAYYALLSNQPVKASTSNA